MEAFKDYVWKSLDPRILNTLASDHDVVLTFAVDSTLPPDYVSLICKHLNESYGFPEGIHDGYPLYKKGFLRLNVVRVNGDFQIKGRTLIGAVIKKENLKAKCFEDTCEFNRRTLVLALTTINRVTSKFNISKIEPLIL